MKVAVYDGKNLFHAIMNQSRSGLAVLMRRILRHASRFHVYALEPVSHPGFKDRPLHRFSQDYSQFDLIIAINCMEPFFVLRPLKSHCLYCLYPQDKNSMVVFSSFKYKYYVDGFIFATQADAASATRQFDLNPQVVWTARRLTRQFGSRFKKAPGTQQKQLRQGIQAFRLKDYKQARNVLEKISQRPEATLLCGFSQLKLQNWIQASECFEKCLRARRCMADACFGHALVHLITGNLRRGIDYLIRARHIHRQHAEVNFTLNLIAEQLGMEKAAEGAEFGNADTGIGVADPEFLFTVM